MEGRGERTAITMFFILLCFSMVIFSRRGFLLCFEMSADCAYIYSRKAIGTFEKLIRKKVSPMMNNDWKLANCGGT